MSAAWTSLSPNAFRLYRIRIDDIIDKQASPLMELEHTYRRGDLAEQGPNDSRTSTVTNRSDSRLAHGVRGKDREGSQDILRGRVL